MNNTEITNQIMNLRREIDYDTRDFTIDFLIVQFKDGVFSRYQRNLAWNTAHKSRFIESILLGYPIPIMFFSDNNDGGRDIIDGVQRMSALERFSSNNLILSDLKRLTELNGLTFKQLPSLIRQKFNHTTLRTIVLEKNTPSD
jgi:uncharacterized protein with ParB-like and HNH nuclease domain